MNGSHYLCDTVYNHHSKWKREYDTHHKHFFFFFGGRRYSTVLAGLNLCTVCALIYGKQKAMMPLSYSCVHNALHWAAFMCQSGHLLTSCLKKLQLCLALTGIPLPQRDTCRCIMQQIFAHTVEDGKCIEAGFINMPSLQFMCAGSLIISGWNFS